MISRFKARLAQSKRPETSMFIEDLLGIVALFSVLFVVLSLPGTL